jgi:hypothetical protein
MKSTIARWTAAASGAALWLVADLAFGHVAFEGIEPGQVFVAGSVAELQWVDEIKHVTTGYELSFLPTADSDPVPIASVPATEHSYQWQVPMEPCTDCYLFIVQVNEGSDYTDQHPITIVAEGDALPTDADAGAGDGREVVGMHLPPEEMPTSSATETPLPPPTEMPSDAPVVAPTPTPTPTPSAGATAPPVADVPSTDSTWMPGLPSAQPAASGAGGAFGGDGEGGGSALRTTDDSGDGVGCALASAPVRGGKGGAFAIVWGLVAFGFAFRRARVARARR